MPRLLAVLLALLLPVSLYAGIVPGAERPVAPPAVTASFEPNRVEMLVTDGNDFLTIWSESTPGREGLYATVIREDGMRRPDLPAPVVRGKVFFARAVWAGDAYLVAAVIDQVPLTLRVDRDGRVLSGPAPFALQNWVGGLAWNGRHVLATTFDYAAGRSTAALLDAHGSMVRDGIALPRAGASTVLAAGAAFVILTHAQTIEQTTPPLAAIEAVRVTDDGTVSAPVTILQQKVYVSFDAAMNGNRIGIALQTNGLNKIELRRVTLDAGTMTVETQPTVTLPQFTQGMQVVPSPDGFTATWSSIESGVPGALFGSIAFDAATPRTFSAPDQMSGYSMESNGRTTFAVWGLAPVRGVSFDAQVTRTTSDVVAVAAAGVRQSRPSMAASPERVLVAWTENTAYDKSDVMVRRFTAEGDPLGPPLRIATNAWAKGNTAVAFTGRMWLVAWQAGTDALDMRIALRRLALDGTPLDAAPLDLGPGWYPTLASNGIVTLLGMTTERHKAMAVLRFSPEGERLDAQPVIVHPQRGYSPSIATNGRELMMVWEASPIQYPNPFGIIGVRFGESGALLDPAPILIATTELTESEPHVASDGTDFLVVYARTYFVYDVFTPYTPTIHAKRVLRTGVLADATAQDAGPFLGTGGAAHVAPLGAGYVVTFARNRLIETETYAASLHALRVDTRGVTVEGVRDLPNGESYEPQHALLPLGNAVMLAYPHIDPSLAYTQRVYLRTLGEEATPRRRPARK
jgi:hypothetical protein